MAKAFHLPEGNELERVRQEYPAYPRSEAISLLERLLGQLRVKSVTAMEYHYKPSWTLAPRRIGDDMFFCVIRGTGQVMVDGRSSKIFPGSCAHFPRGSLHSARSASKGPFHIISIHYTATLLESLTLHELVRFPDIFKFGVDSLFMHQIQEACREYALRPPGWERGLEALVIRLLLHIIREATPKLRWESPADRLLDLQRLMPALEAMRAKMSNPLSMPDIAKLCGVSVAQFRRLFHRVMKVSPVQYLRMIRMQEACRLLRETNQTIDAIAIAVGYAETAFFCHSFRKLIGSTPGSYRKTFSV